MRAIVKSLALTAALFGLAFASPAARATSVLPGGPTVVPNAQANPLSGTTIVGNTGVQNFSIVGGDGSTLVGTGQAWVVRGFSGNTLDANDLTFVYQVSLTSGTTSTGGAQVLERVTASSFDSFTTDVGYNMSGTQVIPSTSDRTANGAIVGFQFSTTEIPIGGTSALLIVNTNATAFTSGTLTAQDGLTANMLGFSPTAVPEPSSLVLGGIGALGMIGFGLRRRKALGA